MPGWALAKLWPWGSSAGVGCPRPRSPLLVGGSQNKRRTINPGGESRVLSPAQWSCSLREEPAPCGVRWDGAAPAWPEERRGRCRGTLSVSAGLMEAPVDVLMDSGFIY